MPPTDDNDFPRLPSESRRAGPRRRLGEFLAAVLLGNALYFLLLFPNLPPSWQHRPFAWDRGLALDFLLCVAAYGLLRLGRRRV